MHTRMPDFGIQQNPCLTSVPTPYARMQHTQAEAMTCSLTLKGAHDQAQQVLLEWQSRKAARVSTFEAHQVCVETRGGGAWAQMTRCSRGCWSGTAARQRMCVHV